jgi:Putative polyhydroxyalkanoic acid system protein (PHA_gran_rgn)
MTKSIVVTVPHALSQDEARRRIAHELEQLKSAYMDKFAHSDVRWSNYAADIRLVALAQEVTAHLDVGANSVRIEVFLPWILAALASRIQEKLGVIGRNTLALTDSSKKS